LGDIRKEDLPENCRKVIAFKRILPIGVSDVFSIRITPENSVKHWLQMTNLLYQKYRNESSGNLEKN